MKCPICNLDLSPLDLVSRTEHVDLCIENGPSILELNDSGTLVVKRSKQRKICPICDKTFQSLVQHFKKCAIKNDVPPSLMLDYWDKITKDDSKIKNKKFPRELLDSFVERSVKDGRVGDQVDFARALSISMAESEPNRGETTDCTNDTASSILIQDQPTVQATEAATRTDATRVLMQNASIANQTNNRKRVVNKKRYRLELVDEMSKRANVALRIDRELAASRTKRYEEALKASKLTNNNRDIDPDCIVLDDLDPHVVTTTRRDQHCEAEDDADRDKLFFRSRMKNCDGSDLCLEAKCKGHELILVMEDHKIYAGASMDAPTRGKEGLASNPNNTEVETRETLSKE